MTSDAREFARLRNTLLLISAAAWAGLVFEPGGMAMHVHGPAMHHGMSIASWALMLTAMMAPVLIPPLWHVRLRSFAARRWRSMSLFVAAYAAVWMMAGAVLLRLFAPQSILPALGVGLIALIWQFSPMKQKCLNRCHAHTELAAFGMAADLDALRFGVRHGVWCAGSCWALMLFPMLLPQGHLVAMAAVAVLIGAERLEHPVPPSWRWRGLGKICGMAYQGFWARK
jgi:predicted metal-binding membrane protein